MRLGLRALRLVQPGKGDATGTRLVYLLCQYFAASRVSFSAPQRLRRTVHPRHVRLDRTRPRFFFPLGYSPSHLQNFFTVANCDTPGPTRGMGTVVRMTGPGPCEILHNTQFLDVSPGYVRVKCCANVSCQLARHPPRCVTRFDLARKFRDREGRGVSQNRPVEPGRTRAEKSEGRKPNPVRIGLKGRRRTIRR